jgi:peptidoglycan/LPS O-acetylase OafA/YrhL
LSRIEELDGIRGLAILAVMACHYYPFTTLLFKSAEFGSSGEHLHELTLRRGG